MQTAKASILIVDDTQKNIHLLSDSLKAHFQILAANNGFKALEIARKLQPDLILLDIMMPEMDGYEVCKQLKSAPQTADIPVIFLTALCSTEEEYKGLLLGAADYISKPFNQQVLLTRIHTQLKLRQAQKELEEHNKKLEYLVEIRTRELSQAHARLKVLDAAKQDFLTAISHELKTPVHGVLGLCEYSFDSLKKYEQVDEYYNAFRNSSTRLQQTIDNALLLIELQTKENYLEMKALPITMLLEAAIADTASAAQDKHIRLNDSAVIDAQVAVNYELVISSLKTLLNTAIRLAKEHSIIHLQGKVEQGKYQLVINFSGSQLQPEASDSFFDVFSEYRSLTYVEEMGLDIPLSARIIEALGGTVKINNKASEQLEIVVQLMLFDTDKVTQMAS